MNSRKRLARDVADSFATHADLVYDVTDTDCRAQNGSIHGCCLFVLLLLVGVVVVVLFFFGGGGSCCCCLFWGVVVVVVVVFVVVVVVLFCFLRLLNVGFNTQDENSREKLLCVYVLFCSYREGRAMNLRFHSPLN